MVSVIGGLAGVLTTVAIIPQIVKAVRTQQVDDISPIFLSILIIGLGLWVFYGLLISDIPIILTNGVSFTLNGIMLFLYYTTKK